MDYNGGGGRGRGTNYDYNGNRGSYQSNAPNYNKYKREDFVKYENTGMTHEARMIKMQSDIGKQAAQKSSNPYDSIITGMTGGVTGMGGATTQRDMNGSIPMHVDYSDSEGEEGERPFIGED